MHFYSLENHVLGCLLHGATTDQCGFVGISCCYGIVSYLVSMTMIATLSRLGNVRRQPSKFRGRTSLVLGHRNSQFSTNFLVVDRERQM